jgi:hypothetical protein
MINSKYHHMYYFKRGEASAGPPSLLMSAAPLPVRGRRPAPPSAAVRFK